MERRVFIAGLVALWAAPVGATPSESAAEIAEEFVYFNTNSLKYHCRTCRALKTCTHCVEMEISKARKTGVACKICGGSCG